MQDPKTAAWLVFRHDSAQKRIMSARIREALRENNVMFCDAIKIKRIVMTVEIISFEDSLQHCLNPRMAYEIKYVQQETKILSPSRINILKSENPSTAMNNMPLIKQLVPENTAMSLFNKRFERRKSV